MARIAVTSCRRPSPLVRRFVNRLASLLPADRVNRGKYSLDELAALLIDQGYTHLIIVDRKHGNPSRLRFYKLYPEAEPFGYITIRGIRRLKPWFGEIDHVRVSGHSEALEFLREFLKGIPDTGRLGSVIEDRDGRITFRVRGKPYGMQFSRMRVSKELEV